VTNDARHCTHIVILTLLKKFFNSFYILLSNFVIFIKNLTKKHLYLTKKAGVFQIILDN